MAGKESKQIADKQSNQANQSKQNFSIMNIYMKNASFESPNSPHTFSVEWKPDVNFDLQMASTSLGDNLYEAVLHLTVTTKLPFNAKNSTIPEDKLAFLIEVHQAGVFAIEGFSEAEIEQILATTAQEILYPYAREFVSNTVAKGAYPQMLLPPVNFNALYVEHKNKQQSVAPTTTAAEA